MPLLVIIGLTGLNTSFYVAFCFLKSESKADYLWAMDCLIAVCSEQPISTPKVLVTDKDAAFRQALDRTFPGIPCLICGWHMEKNVLVRAGGKFEEGEERDKFIADWAGVVRSKDVESFDEAWREIQVAYREKLDIIAYLRYNWISLKQSIIHARVDQLMHFGNRTTQQVEGSHARLKSYLQVSTGDLKKVNDKIQLLFQNQIAEHVGAMGRSQIRVPFDVHTPFYALLKGKITFFALAKIRLQKIQACQPGFRDGSPCSGLFTSSMGLPCSHKIDMKKRLNGILQLTDINKHWYYKNVELPEVENPPPFLDPALARPRGRPSSHPARSARPDSSTQREPSAFERQGRVTRSATRSQQLPLCQTGGARAIAARTIAARQAMLQNREATK